MKPTKPDTSPLPRPELEVANEAQMREKLRARNLARGIRIFVVLGVAAAIVVIALTVSRETITGLTRLKWYWLVLTCVLWFVAIGADGARLSILSRAGEHRMGIIRSAEIILVG